MSWKAGWISFLCVFGLTVTASWAFGFAPTWVYLTIVIGYFVTVVGIDMKLSGWGLFAKKD